MEITIKKEKDLHGENIITFVDNSGTIIGIFYNKYYANIFFNVLLYEE